MNLKKYIHRDKFYAIECFKNLSYLFMKKGKKKIINKNLKKILYKDFSQKAYDNWSIIRQAFFNNTPIIKLIEKSRNNKWAWYFFRPMKLKQQSRFGNLIIKKTIKEKKGNNILSNILADELQLLAFNKSKINKDRFDEYKTITEKWKRYGKKKTSRLLNKNINNNLNKRFFSTSIKTLKKENLVGIFNIKGYDFKNLQIILKDIIEESKNYNFNISGQIILPSKKTLFTVLRSPHIDKKARDQFEIRTYKIGFKINFENISDENLKNILTFIQYIKLRSLGNKLNYKLIKKL